MAAGSAPPVTAKAGWAGNALASLWGGDMHPRQVLLQLARARPDVLAVQVRPGLGLADAGRPTHTLPGRALFERALALAPVAVPAAQHVERGPFGPCPSTDPLPCRSTWREAPSARPSRCTARPARTARRLQAAPLNCTATHGDQAGLLLRGRVRGGARRGVELVVSAEGLLEARGAHQLQGGRARGKSRGAHQLFLFPLPLPPCSSRLLSPLPPPPFPLPPFLFLLAGDEPDRAGAAVEVPDRRGGQRLVRPPQGACHWKRATGSVPLEEGHWKRAY